MEQCSICSAWFSPSKFSPHRCEPKWEVEEVWDGKPDGEVSEVRAYDAEEAAEEWAKTQDEGGDYTIVGGATVTVRVRKQGQGEWRYFTVYGEGVPQYYANELVPEGGV